MTADQRKLVFDMTLGRIAKDEFINLFPACVEPSGTYLIQALKDAIANKTSDDIEPVMLIGFHFGFPAECANQLRELILESWHTSHEDIAMVLCDLKAPLAVDCLYRAALMRLPYLDFDEAFALGVKCTYALRAIGTSSAKEKLALLANSENEILAENAARLLSDM